MDRDIRFYLDKTDWLWYADIPEWEGPKSDLEMVMGADKMLEIMTQGETEITLSFSTSKPDIPVSTLSLVKLGDSEGGGYYNFDTFQGIEYEMSVWLCDVTKFVFGDIPDYLYICGYYV